MRFVRDFQTKQRKSASEQTNVLVAEVDRCIDDAAENGNATIDIKITNFPKDLGLRHFGFFCKKSGL